MHDEEFETEEWDRCDKLWLVSTVLLVAAWAIVLVAVAVAYAA